LVNQLEPGQPNPILTSPRPTVSYVPGWASAPDIGRALLAMLRTVARQGIGRRCRGPVRGPSHRCQQRNQSHRRHCCVVSAQLARMVHQAVVLIIRRSWVRAPPAPPAVSPQFGLTANSQESDDNRLHGSALQAKDRHLGHYVSASRSATNNSRGAAHLSIS
jgi:hypothetical protein